MDAGRVPPAALPEVRIMGWVDPQYIPLLQRDWRYSRLLRATEQLARRRERERREQRARENAMRCGCQDGQTTVLGADGRPCTVQCTRCDGSGEVPDPVDDPRDGHGPYDGDHLD
ncbi:hypothetical protein [Streptomyces rimosus]|uniref:hypothetical protein n=1 Tax=Streptomyces rimosus TaxID=1927 RepID=UPI00067BDD00|nr:hypothetical protein [Streptomyces rimosus]